MQSSAAVLDRPPVRGSQEPFHLWLPPGKSDEPGDFGDRAVQLAELAGLNLDPWQQLVLRMLLRTAPASDQWAAYESLLLVPRQNGKSVTLEAFDLAKLYLSEPGHMIMHTAHLFPTAMESFRHLTGLIRNCPELWAEVERVSNAHGQEGIELRNGSRLRFAARGVNGAGRGFSPDDVVFDEAYRLPVEAEESLLYAISAKRNPQLVYASSTGMPDSHILWSLVERGRAGGDPSLMLAEWSADPKLDLNDEVQLWEAVRQANPALGYRLDERKTLAEYRKAVSQDRLEGFGRERLGWWAAAGSVEAVIPLEVWDSLADRDEFPAPHVGKVVLAVDSDPNRSRTSIAAAGLRADGLPLVELIDNEPGVDWAEARIVEICARNSVAAVVIDRRSAAASLIAPLEAAKVRVIGTDAAKMAQACGGFYDAATETKQLRHLAQKKLTEALRAATTRPLGDAWAWDRKNATNDITPLTAATLALWGWSTGQGIAKNAGKGRVIVLSE